MQEHDGRARDHSRRESQPDLIGRIAARAATHPRQTALRGLNGPIGDPVTVDYAGLMSLISRVSSQIRVVEPCGPIGVACSSPLAFAIAVLGCIDARVPSMPLEPAAMDSGASWHSGHVISDAEGFDGWTPDGHVDEALTLLRRHDAPATELRLRPNIVLLQRTSGTTGEPKTVLTTTANLEAAFAQAVDAYGLSEADRFVSWSPLHHSMGLMNGLLLPLSIGATSTILDPGAFAADPAVWLDAIDQYRGTYSSAPVFGFSHCADRIPDSRKANLDLSSWRVARTAAGPLWADVLGRFTERFKSAGFRPEAIRPSYGLTEATLFVTATRQGSAPPTRRAAIAWRGAELAAAGTPVAGTDVSIVDPETLLELDPGSTGEIAVSGPQVAAIAGEPERAPGDQLLLTGDLGVIEDGVLWVVGRRRDIVKIRGVGHSLAAIEHALDDPARRGRTVALGAAGPTGEELWIVTECPDETDAEAAARNIARKTARSTGVRASQVLVVREGWIPVTGSGKPRRRECHQLILDGDVDVLATWPAT